MSGSASNCFGRDLKELATSVPDNKLPYSQFQHLPAIGFLSTRKHLSLPLFPWCRLGYRITGVVNPPHGPAPSLLYDSVNNGDIAVYWILSDPTSICLLRWRGSHVQTRLSPIRICLCAKPRRTSLTRLPYHVCRIVMPPSTGIVVPCRYDEAGRQMLTVTVR